MGREFACAFVVGAIVFATDVWAGTVYHGPYSHYSVNVIAGPISGIGANGDRTDFNDDGNQLFLNVPGGRETLTRQYTISAEPDPGWEFTSISLMALGQGAATTATFKAGPVTYNIGEVSGNLTASPPSDDTAIYSQNLVWDYAGEFYFGKYDIAVPPSGFTLNFSTTLYAGIYKDGGESSSAFMGDSRGPYTFAIGANLRQAQTPEPAGLAILLALGGIGLLRRRVHS